MSKAHSSVADSPALTVMKLAPLSWVAELKVTCGAVRSIVNERFATTVFSAQSVPRTSKVCVPSLRPV